MKFQKSAPIFLGGCLVYFILGLLWGKVFNLNFAPDIFINKLFEFTFSVFAITLSFYLGKVYWEEQSHSHKEKKMQDFLTNYSHQWIVSMTEIKTAVTSIGDHRHPYEQLRVLNIQLTNLQNNLSKFTNMFQLLYDSNLNLDPLIAFNHTSQSQILIGDIIDGIEKKNIDRITRSTNKLYNIAIKFREENNA